jgi:hypothetical protein
MVEAHDDGMKLRTAIATATTAAVLATSGVALAGATTGSGAASSSDHPAASTVAAEARAHPALRHRARVRIRRLLRGAAGVVTKTIGIDRPTLRQDLRNGQTIAQVATANNVDPQTVIDALVQAADRRIDTAVANGRLTPERAAKIKDRLPDRITHLVNNWHPRRVRQGTAA